MLQRSVAGQVDWLARRQRKLAPVGLGVAEREAFFAAALQRVRAVAAPHLLAAAMAVATMAEAAACRRDQTLRLEAQAFGRVARTQAAASLVQRFPNEQALRRLQRQAARGGPTVAVAGSGATAVVGPALLQPLVRSLRDEGVDASRIDTSCTSGAGRGP